MPNNAAELSDKLGSLFAQLDELDVEGKQFEQDLRETYQNLSALPRMLRNAPSSLDGGLVGEMMRSTQHMIRKVSGE